MAEVHTRVSPCLWPAHIITIVGPTALTSGWRVVCQNTGPITQLPGDVPAPQLFQIRAQAQAAYDAWLTTVGAV